MSDALGAALMLTVGLSVIGAAIAQQIPFNSVTVYSYILKNANDYRESAGLPRLAIENSLGQAAQQYATFLVQNDRNGDTADGENPEKRVSAEGYKPCFVAENIYDYSSQSELTPELTVAQEALKSWKASPVDDANLKEARASDMGVGAAGWTHNGKNLYRVVLLLADDCRDRSDGKVRPAF